MINVEILTIGNEILLGLVPDTNSSYLCRLVRGMGGRVRRIAVLRDEIDAISEEIKGSLERGTDLIFTCGGLGPTDDDLTLAAVAKATNTGLSLNAIAQEFVENRYKELASQGFVSKAEMTESRMKMACLPEEAQPIQNPVGAAPAVIMKTARSRIVCLPGVPAELKGLIEGPLKDMLAEVFGRGSYRERELIVECGDESELAPALRKVSALHPDVYFKSRASHFGADVKFRILISASGKSDREAGEIVERAASDLTATLSEAGINQPR